MVLDQLLQDALRILAAVLAHRKGPFQEERLRNRGRLPQQFRDPATTLASLRPAVAEEKMAGEGEGRPRTFRSDVTGLFEPPVLALRIATPPRQKGCNLELGLGRVIHLEPLPKSRGRRRQDGFDLRRGNPGRDLVHNPHPAQRGAALVQETQPHPRPCRGGHL